MSILHVQEIFETLRDAGLNVSLAPEGGLGVAPASCLTPDLRNLIRCNKAVLLDWLLTEATNDPGGSDPDFQENLQKPEMTAEADDPAPEPPTDPNAWRELAWAYHEHHFGCSTCIAAGRGAVYGLRCGVGAALWNTYQDSA